ncbi:NupC/NupG family nucleoside CNT transporter [Myxococcota bacterium]|nr:NupC/NupG family nucleoside CNT transporter [Myxococcota bacterium]MBU1430828.1 NupC/NupG family nucleoside CNT transporter [Myxococcota bacterium]MBU1898247.1 NupC/NupG family nucleoside CNT transporter [Myxococcota bacterium]
MLHRLGAVTDVPWSSRLISLLGLVALLLTSWALSTHRRLVPWRIIGWGLSLQVLLGVLLLRTRFGAGFFDAIGAGVSKIMSYYREGTLLVFGKDLIESFPFSFLLNVLPTIIFFSSLMAVLYHLRIMQLLVGGIAWLMRRTLRTSGAESLSAAGNIFVGQTEAPLLIRPYVSDMTPSELMAVMVGGFATVAGGVMVAYVSMFGDAFPGIAGHLMIASIMSAPAALLTAKLMHPETRQPVTAGEGAKAARSDYANVIDAAATGAADGLKLAMNVAAMLLAFVGLVALLNGLIGGVGGWFGAPDLSFQQILGWLLAPVAWLMGIPWVDAVTAGSLLGTKTVLNEFYAYEALSGMVKSGAFTDPRSAIILTYALCGFANFGSIAIQVGGISAIAPTRRKDLARLGLRAMIGGTIAAFMTATVAGILI